MIPYYSVFITFFSCFKVTCIVVRQMALYEVFFAFRTVHLLLILLVWDKRPYSARDLGAMVFKTDYCASLHVISC